MLTKSQRMVWDMYLSRTEELGIKYVCVCVRVHIYIYIYNLGLKRKEMKKVKEAEIFGWINLIHSLS